MEDLSHSLVDASSDSTLEGSHSEHHAHVPKFIDEMTEKGETELLEMLHMPILHGGVREVLLFSGLETSSAGSFTLACLVLVVCAFLLELLRLLASHLEARCSEGSSAQRPVCECKHCNSLTSHVKGMAEWKRYDAVHDSSLPEAEASAAATSSSIKSAVSRWIVWFEFGGLQFLVYIISTFLMLIAMTMNIYFIISLAFGFAIGKVTVPCVKNRLMDSHN